MRRAPYLLLLLAACSPPPVVPGSRPMAMTGPMIVVPGMVLAPGSAAGAAAGDPMPVHVPLTVPHMPVAVPDSSVEHTMLVAPSGSSFGLPFQLGSRPGAPSSPTNARIFLYGDTLKIPRKKK